MRNIFAPRYSYQRTYAEIWHLNSADEAYSWKTSDSLDYEETYSFDITQKYIPRTLTVPVYNISCAAYICEKGTVTHKDIGSLSDIRYISSLSNETDGYLNISEMPLC